MEVYDMPRGWKQQELWRRKAYSMWKGMWRRVFNPKMKYWNDCEIWEDFKFFSNFLSWLESQPNFEEFCSTCHEIGWSVDKDMKVKDNKKYFPEFMSLVTKSENYAKPFHASIGIEFTAIMAKHSINGEK